MSEIFEDEASASRQPGAAAPPFIVGLGASAGGVKALQRFFSHVPHDSGMVYVVVLHLSPDYESRLPEILQATASIPISQVVGETPIAANHAYVIPPNRSLSLVDNTLVAGEVTDRRAPIDFFFRTLAEVHGARAISVVLSGSGLDGSTGFKRVKEYGGLTIAQDPREAEFADMPSNAIATGFVDLVLPVAAMAARILQYVERLQRVEAQLPVRTPVAGDSEALREILLLLRQRTGHDFSSYKGGTVLRRIQRRMSVRGLGNLSEYTRYMREHNEEPPALLKDLLISVTNFFRDREAFAALERRVIPRLLAGKQTADQIRVWSAGCATGEEAYSLAMLLSEALPARSDAPTIQIFATDLDEQAIAVAREGFYPDPDVVDVSEARLHRFFQRVPGGYQVRRELRELLLFARHNMIKDPPFSHLDLVACRNVLIYLNRSLQRRVVETFHFALRPGGLLMMGLSESPEGTGDLFAIIDKEAHIYESRAVSMPAPPPLADPIPLTFRPQLRGFERTSDERISPPELHQRLLEQYAPPSLVVTDDLRVVHVSERAGRYLHVPGGEPSRDILQLVRPEMRVDLRTALHEAARKRTNVDIGGVRLPSADGDTTVRISVRPVVRDSDPVRGYFLVIFDHGDSHDLSVPPGEVQLTSPTIVGSEHLDQELTHVTRQLRETIEQYEIQVEEAKASNEELQAMNEELRSAAEELETSKEELQSVNEELTTVNQELKIKIDELGATNNDFANFINSTDIATIFLDRDLRVKLSTPRATDVFNLLPGDIGRPLSDITSKLSYPTMHEDLRQVLERLHTIERDLSTLEGRWYLTRVLPYRTTDNRIEGVVITFLDVTTLRDAELRVRRGEERLRLLIDSAVDYAMFTLSENGTIDTWNAGAQRMFGYSTREAIGAPVAVLFTPEDRAAGVPDMEMATARATGRSEDERWHLRRDGTRVYCSGVMTRLGGAEVKGFAKVARDLTEQRQAQTALREAHDEMETRVGERTSELQREVLQHSEAKEHVTMLLRRLVTSQEDQRARIARDLHDQLGQQLTALRLTLERHQTRCGSSEAADDLQSALKLAAAINEELDFLAWELRPAILDDLGLAAALPKFVAEWSAHYGIAAEFRTSGFEEGHLSREAEVTFYRIAQEALNNVIKHAHASKVAVILETRGDTVSLVVDDNGVGFDLADRWTVEKGVGLIGMRERAALIGATLDIESSLNVGTTYYLRARKETHSA